MIGQFVHSTAARVLAFTGIFWLISFFVCKQLLWRDPHSAFFEEEKVYDLGYSLGRAEESQHFIDSFSNGTGRRQPVQDPLICAAFTTFQREGKQYVQEAIGSVLVGLSKEERETIDLRLLFTHVEPAKHPDWNQTWLEVVDEWSGYNVSKEGLQFIQGLEESRNFYAKGVYDYVYVLNHCLHNSTAPYIAIFEDDIIAAEGWLFKTLKALSQLRRQSKSWLYLRLFYTETSLGWDDSIDFWYRNMYLTFAMLISSTAAILLLIRKCDHRIRHKLDLLTIAAISLVSVPAFTALFFMIGKYNIMPLQGAELMNKWGCCTQALVFPRHQVESLINFLQERGSGQTDALIEEYADRARLQRYALAPQVVQHVGLISSRDNLQINTRSTWAFWFEAQDPGKLRREHAAMDWEGIVTGLRSAPK
ncbi:T-complex protein 1 subunit zeta [Elsinoe australis]|uniref:T-complex protein 1 subunit zeta n=1 Tax=Elsinoe australis TaxID=40998 RepID=A0A2P7ZAF8_9PEZI|nr:T-complex protein 1 subunit zeta [Elsinoe australis]